MNEGRIHGGVLQLQGKEEHVVLETLKSLTESFVLTSIGSAGFSDDTHEPSVLQVRYLDISGCGLSALPPCLSAFKNLEVLDVAENNIVLTLAAVEMLGTLRSLTWVYLRGNCRVPDRFRKNKTFSRVEFVNYFSCVGARKACLCILLAHKRRNENVFGKLPRDLIVFVIVPRVWGSRKDSSWKLADMQDPN